MVCSKYNTEQTDKDHARANVIHLVAYIPSTILLKDTRSLNKARIVYNDHHKQRQPGGRMGLRDEIIPISNNRVDDILHLSPKRLLDSVESFFSLFHAVFGGILLVHRMAFHLFRRVIIPRVQHLEHTYFRLRSPLSGFIWEIENIMNAACKFYRSTFVFYASIHPFGLQSRQNLFQDARKRIQTCSRRTPSCKDEKRAVKGTFVRTSIV